MEYTREVGKSRFDNSAAKSLIYDIQEVTPDRGQRTLYACLLLPRERALATYSDVILNSMLGNAGVQMESSTEQ